LIWNFVLQHMKDVKKKMRRRRGLAVLVLCFAVLVQGCAGIGRIMAEERAGKDNKKTARNVFAL